MNIQNLQIQNMEIKNVTQRTISHIGGKGTGKTTLIKLAIEALPRGMPAVIFDPLNVLEDADRKYVVNNKSTGYGAIFAKVVNKDLEKNKLVIISFDRLVSHEITPFVDAFLPGLKMKDGMWIFDEIHEFVPQMGGSYSFETERLIRHTRNDNNGVWMTTQRPAFASKKVLALTDFLILFRVMYPNDLEVVDKLVSRTDRREEIMQGISSKPFLEGYTLDYDPDSGAYS